MSAAEQGRGGKHFDHRVVVNNEWPNGHKKLATKKSERRDALDLVAIDLVASAVIELGGAG